MSKPPEPFTTLCFYCRNPYDVLPASFYSCEGQERSFVCPTCQKCFCDAPVGFRRSFWITAPEPIWKRRSLLREERLR